MSRRRGISLRARLIAGAGMIAAIAALGALLSLYGAREISRRIDTAVMAQQRMELLSVLSARVNDYGMVAAEVMRIGSRTSEERLAILASRSEIVDDVFERIDRAIAASVNAAASEGDYEQNRRATQGLGVARMRAQFNQLRRTLTEHNGIDPSRLRTALDGFATQFSPLLDQAIAQERRDRDAAFRGADAFRSTLGWIAAGVLLLAVLALSLFQFGLVRPLIGRIERITQTAHRIGRGDLDSRLGVERRDELGLLFAHMNHLSARLQRQRDNVEADRAALNEIIRDRSAELTEANKRLERADAQRRRFFADVSHELRTPLTVILGEAQLGMRASDTSPDDSRESMQLIYTRARRLNRRIDDLLRVARSESGEIDVANATFDLNEAARGAIDDLGAIARRRGITLTLKAGNETSALGDEDWTRQVISGLLDNALRHSPDGAPIALTVTANDDTIALTVEDEGAGITKADQRWVFERFRRGTDATERTGFGVGLALAKWIIEGQGGRIQLESPARNNKGTRVMLHLPRSFGEDNDDVEARPHR